MKSHLFTDHCLSFNFGDQWKPVYSARLNFNFSISTKTLVVYTGSHRSMNLNDKSKRPKDQFY